MEKNSKIPETGSLKSKTLFFEKDSMKQPGTYQMKTEDKLADWIIKLTISGDPIPDFDHKAEYHKHLEEKYGL
jgi:hypothetical protein